MRKQCEVLEQQPNITFVGRYQLLSGGDCLAANPDLTRIGPVKACDKPQSRRFAAPGRSQKAQHFTFPDIEGYVFYNGIVAEVKRYVF